MKLKFHMQIEENNLINIVDALQEYKPSYQIKVVRWRPSLHEWMKGNTDGASRGNPGPSLCAFCIRNSEGNLIIAKGSRIHDTISIVAEAIAIKECLRFCRDNSIHLIEVETDSWTLVQVLQGEWEVPWCVVLEVNFIRELMSQVTARVVHSLWEGNTLADYFANMVLDFAGDFQITNVEDIPAQGRRIIKLDK